MSIPIYIIVGGVILAVLGITSQTKKKILKHLDLLVKELQIELKSLVPLTDKPEWFSKFDRSISGEVEGRKVNIRIYQTSSGGEDTWKIELVWECHNLHRIDLQLDLVTIFAKLKKKTLGMQDIEVFQEEFDETFILRCNHRHFALQTFTAEYCDQLLDIQEKLLPIKVVRNKVVYSGALCLDSTHKRQHLVKVAKALHQLANMAEQWDPPYKVSGEDKCS